MSKRDDYWQQLIASLEASGLSRAEFCRRRGVNYQAMSYQVKRQKESHGESFISEPDATGHDDPSALNQALREDAGASFVEVTLPITGGPALYEVVLGSKRSIRIGTNFDGEVLRRLIRTIESC